MAVGKRGITGGLSGSVGGIVGSSWKGRAVFKAKPLSVANPRTTPQVNQRTKFSAIAVFGSLILSSWVKPIWDRFSGDISGYNKFCSLNKANSSNSGVLDYPNLIMSKGKMQVPVLSAAFADVSEGAVGLSVELPNDLTWGQAGESIYVLAVNTTTSEVLGVTQTVGDPSDTQQVTISTSDFVAGNAIRFYVAIKRTDGTQVSDSATVTVNAIA